MDKIREFIEKLPKNKRFIYGAIAVGVLGMLLIIFSGGSSDDSPEKSSDTEAFSQNGAYEEELEKRLAEILSSIQGVGDVNVMITLSSTEEYVYAEETDTSADRQQREYVIADKGGIITKVNSPAVTGAVIVCEGGGDTRVCEKVYEAVSVALGLPSNRICVVKME
ncbi:MAG: hypothetical protein SOU50_05750 [Oscillospiraceae bacterium]|nr:hypothetical protein [Oscillospiraceae bacterium]MDY2847705.1 hypothetical protein [Oscillospiraceae bacterium]